MPYKQVCLVVGHFYLMVDMFYTKAATSIAQQMDQLQSRGLQIENKDEAGHCLLNMGYYRLAGYWWPMQADKVAHIFKPNSRFEDVIALYNFDRELRLLLFEVIEKIEIALRTRLSGAARSNTSYVICALMLHEILIKCNSPR